MWRSRRCATAGPGRASRRRRSASLGSRSASATCSTASGRSSSSSAAAFSPSLKPRPLPRRRRPFRQSPLRWLTEPLPSPAWSAVAAAVQGRGRPRHPAAARARAAARPRAAYRRALDHLGRRGRHPLRRLLLREVVHRERPDRPARPPGSRSLVRDHAPGRGARAPPPPRRAVSLGRALGIGARPLLPRALRGLRLLRPPAGRRRLRPDVHRHRARHRRRRRLRAPGDGGAGPPGRAPDTGAAGQAGAQRARAAGLSVRPRSSRAGHRALPHLDGAQPPGLGRHRAAAGADLPAAPRRAVSGGAARPALRALPALPPDAARPRVGAGGASRRGGSPDRRGHGGRLLLGRLRDARSLAAAARSAGGHGAGHPLHRACRLLPAPRPGRRRDGGRAHGRGVRLPHAGHPAGAQGPVDHARVGRRGRRAHLRRAAACHAGGRVGRHGARSSSRRSASSPSTSGARRTGRPCGTRPSSRTS